MKKLVKLLLLGGFLTWLVQYLQGETKAGEWQNTPDTDPGL